jgi:ATP-dependent helicase/nuclease subunit A
MSCCASRKRRAVARAIAPSWRGHAPGDVYVLCRKRETLRLVAAALEREQIAHSAVEDTTLASTPEAQDLIAVLDCVVSPAHRLSLARALRSPLFGASDDDLLASRPRRSPPATATGGARCGDGRRRARRCARARTLLRDWRAAAAALPPHDLLDRIVHEGELRERTVAVVPPEQRALALDAIDARAGAGAAARRRPLSPRPTASCVRSSAGR